MLTSGDEKKILAEQVGASAKQPAAAKQEPAKPIEDAGEKIGGARKDRWKERGLNLDDLDAMTEHLIPEIRALLERSPGALEEAAPA